MLFAAPEEEDQLRSVEGEIGSIPWPEVDSGLVVAISSDQAEAIATARRNFTTNERNTIRLFMAWAGNVNNVYDTETYNADGDRDEEMQAKWNSAAANGFLLTNTGQQFSLPAQPLTLP